MYTKLSTCPQCQFCYKLKLDLKKIAISKLDVFFKKLVVEKHKKQGFMPNNWSNKFCLATKGRIGCTYFYRGFSLICYLL